MVKFELTDEQAELVGDLLDMWLDGYDEATNDVWKDRTHDTPEEMLEALDGMHKTFRVATEVKGMLSTVKA